MPESLQIGRIICIIREAGSPCIHSYSLEGWGHAQESFDPTGHRILVQSHCFQDNSSVTYLRRPIHLKYFAQSSLRVCNFWCKRAAIQHRLPENVRQRMPPPNIVHFSKKRSRQLLYPEILCTRPSAIKRQLQLAYVGSYTAIKRLVCQLHGRITTLRGTPIQISSCESIQFDAQAHMSLNLTVIVQRILLNGTLSRRFRLSNKQCHTIIVF